MESYALGRTAIWKNIDEWIVVKGICDWGDHNKHEAYQPFAAACVVKVVQAIVDEAQFLEYAYSKIQTPHSMYT